LTPKGHEPWIPGSTGKGLTSIDGKIWAWKTDAAGWPHHTEINFPLGTIGPPVTDATVQFDIDPDGTPHPIRQWNQDDSYGPVDREWNFSGSHKQGNLQPWEPGLPGKAMLTDDGKIHTWVTDMNGWEGGPHHNRAADALGYNGHDSITDMWNIYPSGEIERGFTGKDDWQNRALLLASDPRLKEPAKNDQWNFEASEDPLIMHHVSPRSNRESILQYGLDPQRRTWDPATGTPTQKWHDQAHIYMSPEPYEHNPDTHDAWAIDTNGLQYQPGTDLDWGHGGEFYTTNVIDPSRLRLVNPLRKSASEDSPYPEFEDYSEGAPPLHPNVPWSFFYHPEENVIRAGDEHTHHADIEYAAEKPESELGHQGWYYPSNGRVEFFNIKHEPYEPIVRKAFERYLGQSPEETPEDTFNRWNFEASTSSLPDWQPGQYGKGVVWRDPLDVRDQPRVKAWPVDERGNPHHMDVKPDCDHGFFIDPDGNYKRITFHEKGPIRGAEADRYIMQQYPDLKPHGTAWLGPNYAPHAPETWRFADSSYLTYPNGEPIYPIRKTDGDDNPIYESSPALKWEPGSYGKGIIHENTPYLWKINGDQETNRAGAPHHYWIGDALDRNFGSYEDWHSAIFVGPDGKVMPSGYNAAPKTVDPYLQMDRRLYLPAVPEWHFGNVQEPPPPKYPDVMNSAVTLKDGTHHIWDGLDTPEGFPMPHAVYLHKNGLHPDDVIGYWGWQRPGNYWNNLGAYFGPEAYQGIYKALQRPELWDFGFSPPSHIGKLALAPLWSPDSEPPPPEHSPQRYWKAITDAEGQHHVFLGDEGISHGQYAINNGIPPETIKRYWGWNPDVGWSDFGTRNYNFSAVVEPKVFLYDSTRAGTSNWIDDPTYSNRRPFKYDPKAQELHIGAHGDFHSDIAPWNNNNLGYGQIRYIEGHPPSWTWLSAPWEDVPRETITGALQKHLPDFTEGSGEEGWKFGAFGQNPNLQWEEGKPGKAFLDINGQLHTWNDDESVGDWTHEEQAMKRGVHRQLGTEAYMDPDGLLSNYIAPEYIQEMAQQDPRFQINIERAGEPRTWSF
jgi:hypothetical protein